MKSKKKTAEKRIALRLETELLEKLDDKLAHMRKKAFPGVRVTRSDAVRVAITRFVET